MGGDLGGQQERSLKKIEVGGLELLIHVYKPKVQKYFLNVHVINFYSIFHCLYLFVLMDATYGT